MSDDLSVWLLEKEAITMPRVICKFHQKILKKTHGMLHHLKTHVCSFRI